MVPAKSIRKQGRTGVAAVGYGEVKLVPAERPIVNVTDLQVYEHQGSRVVTLAQIDAVHGRPDGTASRNFIANKDRLIEGEDYWLLTVNEIRGPSLVGAFSSRISSGTVLSESGYMMLVKSFTDDLAWRVQRELVKSYFRVSAAPKAPPTAVELAQMVIETDRLLQLERAEKVMAIEQAVMLSAEVEELGEELEQAQPKVEAFDCYMNSDGLFNRREVATSLGLEQQSFNLWLAALGHWNSKEDSKKGKAKAPALRHGLAARIMEPDPYGISHAKDFITPAGVEHYRKRMMKGECDNFLTKESDRYKVLRAES